MALRDDDRWSEKRDQPEGAYEHPALEPETGYWAGRWPEFKRLFKKSWDDEFTRTVLFLSAAGFILAAIGGPLFGWR